MLVKKTVSIKRDGCEHFPPARFTNDHTTITPNKPSSSGIAEREDEPRSFSHPTGTVDDLPQLHHKNNLRFFTPSPIPISVRPRNPVPWNPRGDRKMHNPLLRHRHRPLLSSPHSTLPSAVWKPGRGCRSANGSGCLGLLPEGPVLRLVENGGGVGFAAGQQHRRSRRRYGGRPVSRRPASQGGGGGHPWHPPPGCWRC